MRALQLALRRGWNFQDDSILVPWDAPSQAELLWWCEEGRLKEGVSLLVQSLDHMFWSDASDQGWCAAVADQLASLVRGRRSSLHQLQGVVGCGEGSVSAPEVLEGTCGRGVLGQYHSGGLPLSSRGYAVTCVQRGRSADPSLGGVRGDFHSSAVCSWEEQCSSERSLTSQPGGGDGVDSPSGGLRLAPQTLTGDDQSFCVISQSPLWCLFCADLGSCGCGHRCHPSFLRLSSGLCIPSVCDTSASVALAQGVEASSHHSDSSVLAAEGVVSGPSGATPGTSSSFTGEVGSSLSTSRPHLPLAVVHGSSSCVEIIKRFTQASGFSHRVAR